MPPLKEPFSARDLAGGQRVHDLAVDDHAADVGDEDEAVGAECDREHRGGVVGVDVQRPSCQRGDHRHARGREEAPERWRHDRAERADVAESRQGVGLEAEVVADQPEGGAADLRTEQLVLLSERLADERQRLGRS